MAERDYYIMSDDTTVAKWENNELTVINTSLLPLYLKRVHNADMWLETRAIDSHRANSRLLKKSAQAQRKGRYQHCTFCQCRNHYRQLLD